MDLGLRKGLTPPNQYPKIIKILKTICRDLRMLHGLTKIKTPSWASNSDSNERRLFQSGITNYVYYYFYFLIVIIVFYREIDCEILIQSRSIKLCFNSMALGLYLYK